MRILAICMVVMIGCAGWSERRRARRAEREARRSQVHQLTQADLDRELQQADDARRAQQQAMAEQQRARDDEEAAARIQKSEEVRLELEETTKKETAVLAKAKKLGFASVDFIAGLSGNLANARDGVVSLNDLSKRAVMLTDVDSGFVAAQVLDQNNALFHDDQNDLSVWLKGYKRVAKKMTLLEGMHLVDAGFEYVAIRGVKTYTTVMGGTKQVIVIEPAF